MTTQATRHHSTTRSANDKIRQRWAVVMAKDALRKEVPELRGRTYKKVVHILIKAYSDFYRSEVQTIRLKSDLESLQATASAYREIALGFSNLDEESSRDIDALLRENERLREDNRRMREEIEDLQKAVRKAVDYYKEERHKNLVNSVEKMRHDREERRKSLKKALESLDKEQIKKAWKQAERFKKTKKVKMKSFAQELSRLFPRGIRGRKVDDKYAKKIYEVEKDDLNLT